MPEVRLCSACGSELASAPPITCSSCGTGHWRNPKPCANAIVVDEGRVLLTAACVLALEGRGAPPGGFCERGEHPIETTECEVLEEPAFE